MQKFLNGMTYGIHSYQSSSDGSPYLKWSCISGKFDWTLHGEWILLQA